MRVILLVFALVVQSFPSESVESGNFRNKVSVGIDGRLRYERFIAYGFRLGTDWKYRLVIEGNQYLHMDQQPDVWLITVSHSFGMKIADWNNRAGFLGAPFNRNGFKFNSEIRKNFRIEDRWALSPYVGFFEYTLTPDEFDNEWPDSRAGNRADFKTELGVELELLF